MDIELLEKEINIIHSEILNVQSIIDIVKDSCQNNDLYNQEVVLSITVQKIEKILYKLDEVSLYIFEDSKIK
jgi:predicted HTH domain antitoxin